MNKKFAIFGLMFFAFSALAGENDINFDATKDRIADISLVVWKVVDNVDEYCNKKNVDLGLNKFKTKVNACAFWTVEGGKPIKCEIYTEKRVSMGTLGHELRHCFYGPFHKRQ